MWASVRIASLALLVWKDYFSYLSHPTFSGQIVPFLVGNIFAAVTKKNNTIIHGLGAGRKEGEGGVKGC